MQLKLTKYEGVDQIPGHVRYGFEFGPILLAAIGSDDVTIRVDGSSYENALAQFKAHPTLPLHFTVDHNPHTEFMPYWQVTTQSFTCFPVLERGLS